MSHEINDVWVVAVTVLDKNANEELTLYYGTRGFTTTPSDTPADTHVAPRLLQPLDISRTMFGERTTYGESTVGLGSIILSNGDGELDAFLDYVVDGKPVTVYVGPSNFAAFPDDFDAVAVATMQDAEVTAPEVRLKLRDRQAEVNVPLQTDKYAGDNSNSLGVEGESDLFGKPKPIVYGTVFNAPLTPVNGSKLIYQVADKQMSSVLAYDRGIPLTLPLDSWDNISPATGFAAALAGIFALTYGDGVMVAGGGDAGSGANGRIETAAIGGSWTNRTSGFGSEDVFALAYGNPFGNTNGIFFAAGSTATLTASRDGAVTWSAETSGFTADDIHGAVYWEAKKLFVLVGNGGKITTSPGNGTWTLRTSGVATNLLAVYASPTHCVAVGSSGVILYTTDGTTWYQAASGTSNALFAVVWGQSGGWVAVGTNIIVSSNNASYAWTSRSTVTASHAAVGYGNGRYVTGAAGDLCFSSLDGKIWTRLNNETSPGVTEAFTTTAVLFVEDVCYRGGHVAGNGKIKRTEEYGTAYDELSDLYDDTQAPVQGNFKVLALSTGTYVRLGSTPEGLVTADVTENATPSNNTTAQIFKRVLVDRAGMSASDYSSSDLTTMDSANDSVIGFFANAEMQVSAALDQIAASVGASWYVDAAGDFRIEQLLEPTGNPVVSFDANDLIGPPLRVSTADKGEGLPVYQSIVRWGQNYAPMTTDIAPGVEADRRAVLKNAWREAEAKNDSVLTRHALAVQLVEDSLLTTEDDAQAEANRRLALREDRHDCFEITVPLTEANRAIDLGDEVELLHDRYGLNIQGDDTMGGQFRVLGVGTNAIERTVRLVIWGKRPFNIVASTGAYLVTSTGAYLRAA